MLLIQMQYVKKELLVAMEGPYVHIFNLSLPYTFAYP
jgi:hypothetical protein